MIGSFARRSVLVGALLVLCAVQPGMGQDLRGHVTVADSLPAGGVRVELHSVSQTAGAIVDSTIAAADGQFEFSLPALSEPGSIFLAGARYEGVLYWGAPIHASNPEEFVDYGITVFDTAVVANAVASLQTAFRHVVITPGHAGLQVSEIIDVVGVPDRTLVPAGDSAFVWTGALPSNAQAVLPGQGGVAPEDLAVSDQSIGFAGALPPSGTRIVLEYLVPGVEYSLRLAHPTERLDLLVMPQAGMTLQVDGLVEASVGTDMTVPVRRFTAAEMAEGSTVSVRVAVEEPGRGRAWVWLLVSLALGVAALLSIRLTRRTV